MIIKQTRSRFGDSRQTHCQTQQSSSKTCAPHLQISARHHPNSLSESACQCPPSSTSAHRASHFPNQAILTASAPPSTTQVLNERQPTDKAPQPEMGGLDVTESENCVRGQVDYRYQEGKCLVSHCWGRFSDIEGQWRQKDEMMRDGHGDKWVRY